MGEPGDRSLVARLRRVPPVPAQSPRRLGTWHRWLWPRGLGWAVARALAALVLVAASAWLGLSWLLTRRWPWQDVDADLSQSDVFKLALAVVAAVGAAYALVINYRRQHHLELDAAGRRDELRLFTERFGAAAAQLGAEQAPVRLAGVYAMAALADEWTDLDRRQQCIDVLCGYLRLPYVGDPSLGHPELVVEQRHYGAGAVQRTETTRYRPGEVHVRRAIVDVIAGHLQPRVAPSWSDRSFDLTGAALIDVAFQGAIFSGQRTSFQGAIFSGQRTSFQRAIFSGQRTSFDAATFISNTTTFGEATFTGQHTSFAKATFSGKNTSFADATFTGETTTFDAATFTGETTTFSEATFSGKRTRFADATFSGEHTWFADATFSGEHTSFVAATFTSDTTTFGEATFSGKRTRFARATFTGETTTFAAATFAGEDTSFERATFCGQQAWFDETTFSGQHTSFEGASFVRKVDGVDRADEVTRAARFVHPDWVNWGPIPPPRSQAGR